MQLDEVNIPTGMVILVCQSSNGELWLFSSETFATVEDARIEKDKWMFQMPFYALVDAHVNRVELNPQELMTPERALKYFVQALAQLS